MKKHNRVLLFKVRYSLMSCYDPLWFSVGRRYVVFLAGGISSDGIPTGV
jgi:hypothetical protein